MDRKAIMSFAVGSAYYIKFLDHIKGASEPLYCQVLGWIIKEEEGFIVLAWWMPEDKDEQLVKDNQELLTIVKSTIIRKKKVL